MNMTTFTTLILLSVFSSTSQAGKILTEDCVAHYDNETGKLMIPCVLYREVGSSVYLSKLWAAHFMRVPTSTADGMLFELIRFEEAHLRYEDIDFTNPALAPPGSPQEVWQTKGVTHGDCVVHYKDRYGNMGIPCLKFWETTRTAAYPKILSATLTDVPLMAEKPLLMEVLGVRDSFIQHEHFTASDDNEAVETATVNSDEMPEPE